MPLLENPVVVSTVIVPEPVIAVVEAIADANSVDAALNIFYPRAANTLLAKVATIKTFSEDALV